VVPLAIGLLLAGTLANAGADEHLLAGAQRFREGRYDEALVEFRVARGMGAQGTEPYVGAALVKLGRHEEAVEHFGGGVEAGPDPLIDYYRALACWGARLYLCADRLLAGVGSRAGPQVAQEAARLRAEIAAEFSRVPSAATVDWYAGRCAEEKRLGRPALGGAYCREAGFLAARRTAAGEASSGPRRAP
jgi:hypothetical protein